MEPVKHERVRTVYELEVYKRAYQAALNLHPLLASETIPKYEQFGGLCDQIRRASRSICANLAEGWGKYSTQKERNQFTRIAAGSASEVIVWLNFKKDFNYLNTEQSQHFLNEYHQIAAMLRAMITR